MHMRTNALRMILRGAATSFAELRRFLGMQMVTEDRFVLGEICQDLGLLRSTLDKLDALHCFAFPSIRNAMQIKYAFYQSGNIQSLAAS